MFPSDATTYDHAYESFIYISDIVLGTNRWIMMAVFSLSFIYLWRKSPSNYPPGPRCLPYIGYIDFFKSKSHIRLSNLKDKYGDVYSLRAGKYDMVVVCSLQGIFEGLALDQDKFLGRPDFHTSKSLFFGNRQRGN